MPNKHKEKHSLEYGQNKIDYTLEYITNRKTLTIEILPNREVRVKAPGNADFAKIEKVIEKRARRIVKEQDYFRQFEPRTPERLYIPGETHLYLGKQYRIKAEQGNDESVKLIGGYFLVTTKAGADARKIKSLMEDWYREKARNTFGECLQKANLRFKPPFEPVPPIVIKKMKTRWGSMSRKGTLTLNLNLIQAPKECIEYVITHELCHIVHKNHSKAFYAMLDMAMPDRKALKSKLEELMA